MKTRRVSSKGQVVLPKSVRESNRWEAGTELGLESEDGIVSLRAIKPFPSTTIEEVQGLAKFKGKRKGLGDRERAIGLQTRTRQARGRY